MSALKGTILEELEKKVDLDELVDIYHELSSKGVNPELSMELLAAEANDHILAASNADRYLMGLAQGGSRLIADHVKSLAEKKR